jgi:uncharacterized membrane protein
MSFLRRFALLLILPFCASLIHAQANVRAANLTFTTIDVPAAMITNVYGINSAGSMTGNYSASIGSPSRGFSFVDANFTLFDYPGGDDTLPFGINESGLISGAASVRNFTAIVSFLYDGSSFTTIRAPGKSITWGFGINNTGNLVGGYGSSGGTKGFVRIGTRFKTISPPGEYVGVFANGINNFRQIVGAADETGFLYSNGQFKKIVVPGASTTKPLGINDSRIIVGWYVTSECIPCGFALQNGRYVSINYPGAMFTGAVGINSAGQIVGSYSFDGMTIHGFVTSPITAADFEQPAVSD